MKQTSAQYDRKKENNNLSRDDFGMEDKYVSGEITVWRKNSPP